MSDAELIARLHLPWPKDGSGDEVTLPMWVLILTAEAADHIEAIEAKLAKAVEALEDIVKDCEADYPPSHGAIKYFARATLAEIKGESHE